MKEVEVMIPLANRCEDASSYEEVFLEVCSKIYSPLYNMIECFIGDSIFFYIHPRNGG